MDTLVGQSLTASNINVQRGHRDVLSGVSLDIRVGEVLSLLGANGAGKSTLMGVLGAELKLDASVHEQDAVVLNGTALSALSAAQQARSRAILPQKPGLAFDLHVSEVVAMGAYPFGGLSSAQVDGLVDVSLSRADITELGQRRYLELSGGEQQRVQFARVTLQILAERQADPSGRYLLLDEPTASLDPLHQQGLLKTVRELARTQDVGVLVILHDINLAACWSDRIALLSQGKIFACDTPSRVLTSANLKQVYGVDVHVMAHPRQPDKPLVVFG
ncbi:MAG: heme ABC transporter ATP-binding protein [Burkholderiaceae bacterium]|nr:heme ABC transporter ATP-binding protein [Burkholderiaceae bacterium]